MNLILYALTGLLLIPVLALLVECVASLWPGRARRTVPAPQGSPRPRVAVLVPAHDEERMLGVSLASLTAQLNPGDRIVVVADNCTDATADVARAAGAQVIERFDAVRRGKGFALDFGLRHLESDPPEVVVICDADCHLHEGSLDALARQVAHTAKPAQAIYLVDTPPNPGTKSRISALAFMVKNLVRPSGLNRLGQPCLLYGTGMAFPWPTIRAAKVATGNIVEDMQLGIDLALAGHAPHFCPDARATGHLPPEGSAAATQRTRWEHGHLVTLFTQVPRLLKAGFARPSLGCLALALELCVPPLSLLVMLLGAVIVATSATALFGTTWTVPLILTSATFTMVVALAIAASRYGRGQFPITWMLSAPLYVAWKIPLYFAFLFKPQKEWVRTARAAQPAQPDADTAPTARPLPAVEFAGAPATGLAWEPNDTFPALGQPSVIDLGGVIVRAVSEKDCAAEVVRRSTGGTGGVVIAPTPALLHHCRADANVAQIVSQAEFVVADRPHGYAGEHAGAAAPAADRCLVTNVAAEAARAGRQVFLLGECAPSVAGVAEELSRRHPELQIVGTAHHAADHNETATELAAALAAAKPDIVLVSLPSPRQEHLVSRLREQVPAAWWVGTGGGFHTLKSARPAAPRWARMLGLGRFYRRRNGKPPRGNARPGASVPTARPDSLNVQTAQPAPAGAPAADDALVYQSFVRGLASGLSMPQADLVGGRRLEPGDWPTSGRRSTVEVLSNLKALILLGGTLRPGSWSTPLERSLLDLPLEDGQSILAHWQREALALAQIAGLAELPVRVMIDPHSPQPTLPNRLEGVRVEIERDPAGYRGTGGLLADACAGYADDDWLAVANAAQVLLTPLPELLADLARHAGDVILLAPTHGMPSGLMLVRRAALRHISPVGYVDFKEQALPVIAKAAGIGHVSYRHPPALPVRSSDEYVHALVERHKSRQVDDLPADPFAEVQTPAFSVVEAGATVAASARVHDAVVLEGAVVEAGAVVVRSVVCPGAVVGAGESAVDRLVVGRKLARR